MPSIAPDECRLGADGIALRFDPECGMICDLTITDQGRTIRPLHVAPWIGEAMPEGVIPHQAKLQGDVFCAPFARQDGGQPLHGAPANGHWRVAARAAADLLEAELEVKVQGAGLTKRLALRDGHPFVYQTHRFTGGSGQIPVANHAMVTLPGGGLLSFSRKSAFRTPAAAPEPDPARGRSALAYPAESCDPARFPTSDGGSADLTRYPFRPQHEEAVVALDPPGGGLGWSAAVRLGQGDLFLSLKNTAQLPMTILWHSEGGRDYAPWLGRHRHCLGIEEGNAPHLLGGSGGLALGGAVKVRQAIGAIAWPDAVRVTDITAAEDHLTIRGEDGTRRRVPFETAHLLEPGAV